MRSNLKIISTDEGYLALAEQCPENISCDWFSSDYWRRLNNIEGSSTGRYTTWFVRYQNCHWVLRHYWRGGLVANLSKDCYVYTGLHYTRGVSELNLLQKLFEEGYAVPKPIAARVIRKGLCYQCDILIERIRHAQDLVAYLTQQAFTLEQWQQLGACIAKFHRRGVYHADLNAKNILIAPDGFYLIDFDRGRIRPVENFWQQSNLERLHRSFVKEKGKQASLAFTDDNWRELLKGYNS